jgi:hypothetical protein
VLPSCRSAAPSVGDIVVGTDQTVPTRPVTSMMLSMSFDLKSSLLTFDCGTELPHSRKSSLLARRSSWDWAHRPPPQPPDRSRTACTTRVPPSWPQMGSPPHPHVVHGPDSGSRHRCRRLDRAAAAPMKPAAMVFSFGGTGQAKDGPCASRPPEPFQPSCSAGCFHRTAGPLN